MTDNEKKMFANFIKSPRYANIIRTQKLAILYDRCKEMSNNKCLYPHCFCLCGKNAPIDPETGLEYERSQ